MSKGQEQQVPEVKPQPKKEDRILGIRFGEHVDVVNDAIEKSGKPIGEFIRDAVVTYIRSQGKAGSVHDRLGNLEGKTEEMSGRLHDLDARLTAQDSTVQANIDKAKQDLDERIADALEEVNEKLSTLDTMNQDIAKNKEDIDTVARAIGPDVLEARA